jgi:SAM-dependent methyltransferase
MSAELITLRGTQVTGAEWRYDNLLRIASRTLAYIPLFNSWEREANEYQWDEIEVEVEGGSGKFRLPAVFDGEPLPPYFQRKLDRGADPEEFSRCRFVRYRPDLTPPGFPALVSFTFSKTNYLDYLKSGENLDAPVPGLANQTLRDQYAPRVENVPDFDELPLTNICGVGLFLITSDNKIIVSQHSAHVAVFPNVHSYSASGTIDWNKFPDPFRGNPADSPAWLEFLHPFTQVARECYEELAYDVDPENIRLFGLGIDSKKLYFQFSFFEETPRSSSEIQNRARHARDFQKEMYDLKAVDFDLQTVVDLVVNNEWEPAAAASILSLCVREFGIERVEQALDPAFVRLRWRQEMTAEWQRRASRRGESAVMSTRYPQAQSSIESEKYVEAVMAFIGADTDSADVLEVGCGTGRITERLAVRARRLTCLDVSKQMIARNRKRLGAGADKVSYQCTFAQDYVSPHEDDIALVSLVLIHNVDLSAFQELTAMVGASADTIFLFEHVDDPHIPHPHTRLRSEEELLGAFKEYQVERRREYFLFQDRILFLKLIRTLHAHSSAKPEEYSDRRKAIELGRRDFTHSEDLDSIQVFYSYSHRDERWRIELEKHLSIMKLQGIIDSWHDRKIEAGKEWKSEINAYLNASQIILLLVSSDFLASDYCLGVEVKRAMQRHDSGKARVIPVIIRSCDWQGAEFGKLQALPTDGKAVAGRRSRERDEAFTNIAKGIREAVKTLRRQNET